MYTCTYQVRGVVMFIPGERYGHVHMYIPGEGCVHEFAVSTYTTCSHYKRMLFVHLQEQERYFTKPTNCYATGLFTKLH